MSGNDLPAGMVTIGDAMRGFLTELEDRCNKHERGGHGADPNHKTGVLD